MPFVFPVEKWLFTLVFLNKYQKKAFVRIFEYKILGKKKRSKGEVLYYLDTLSTMTYNVNEVETSIFGQIPNICFPF
jgi:hypothetical protein